MAGDPSVNTETGHSSWQAALRDAPDECLHLTLLWSSHAPERTGETCALVGRVLFGRGGDSRTGDPARLELVRQRPGSNQATGTLDNPKLSRRQWLLEPRSDGLWVENVGRRALQINGVIVRQGLAQEGDTLGVEGVLLCLVESRPRLLPRHAYEEFDVGKPDADGIVGESASLWRLRREIALISRENVHCLVLGESGAGKELAARSLHRRSAAPQAPFVARNAATIPESLMEAELFGNVANYPNASTPARQGLVGSANGGMLFLDEVTELSEAQQANLLRVLDAGEYQRLGEDRPRISRFRLIAATNRPLETLKHDFLARFAEHIHVPGLCERRADIPLLLTVILEQLGAAGTRIQPLLLDHLVRHRYSHHFRELERLVRLSRRGSSSDTLELTPEVRAELDFAELGTPRESEIREALANTKSATEAAKRLGLPSRFALYRLTKKLGIDAENH
jgi:two-component system nitrogen regulation response regulator GlnG/two-component system response regulator HydG